MGMVHLDHLLKLVTPHQPGRRNRAERIFQLMNDIIDLNNERIDNLAALITVSAEQLDDRLTAEAALEEDAHRASELTYLVFGSDTPSIESYLSSRTLQAA